MSRRPRGTGESLKDFPLFGAISAVVFAFLYMPLVFVVGYSFNANRVVTVWKGFTLDWYLEVLQNDDIQRALMNSLRVAVVATALSVVLALGLAIGLLRLARSGNSFAWALIGAPLIIPEIVFAIGTLSLFVQMRMPLGVNAITLAHTAFCIPFALLPIRARLKSVDLSVYEAAADLGANEWRIFRRVTLPLLAPGVVAGALLAFIISLDDFIVSYFLAGPGGTTLPVYIFGMIRNAITPGVNALSTLLLLVSVLIVSISYYTSRRKR
ncbi:MAG: ABC transporter permease [Candidatus Nanopelagicales bacterium]|nr:ABC transporter permease [Candidatus Nanopelagicales bacterium]MCF8536876.1 ABC transporter permease [Candidatus Nanopelagicales bacterium]MCF8542354.1 ABC transporter permease [Candidatus Nanopelagicales bacterium]MCF8557645.1 ABC transporter permease [Candidatus Nanopelagicales bacterium]